MIAVVLAASVALPAQWDRWAWSAAIGSSNGAIRQVTLPAAVLGGAQPGLDDVRVIDGAGNQIPYTVIIRRGSQGVQWVDARLDDYGYVPGRYTQVVATAAVPKHDYTSLELSTPAGGFSSTVDVLASDDRVNWRVIKSGAPIFDFQSEGLGSNTAVRIPPSHSRYYRVRVHDARAAFPIDSVRLAEGASTPPELMRFAGRVSVSNVNSQTVITLDTGFAHLPVSLVRLNTSTPRFSRDAVLETSDDGTTWTQAGSATLERTPSHESRSISFDESQGRYWRLTISNGSNAPLDKPGIEAWGTPRHVVFAAAAEAAKYRLAYGNPQAQAPAYDFSRIEKPSALQAAADVELGPPQANAAYQAPAVPWTESHRWALWVALAAAVLVIGGMALRVLVTEGKQAA